MKGKQRAAPLAEKAKGWAARTFSRYMRDTKSGVLAGRAPALTAHRDDVRRSWSRAAALAMDLIQNSGKLKGATDQVIADTVGVGLTLTPNPDLDGFGYDDKDKADWIRLVKKRWRAFWHNARECDMRGKFTGPQMVDIALRWHIAYGEATGVFDFFTADERRRYGIVTGTKLCLVPPPRLVQDSNRLERLFQGIRHDDKGRAVSYRFEIDKGGMKVKRDYAAHDADGRPLVLHVFDPMDATDVRGISTLTPAFRKHIQAEMLDDATLQMAILQTVFAITLTSDMPSRDAFEGLEALKESNDINKKDDEGKDKGKAYVEEFLNYLGYQIERGMDSKISVGSDPQVSHLGPGEKLGLETARVPGQTFLPFSSSLNREMARAIGITYGGLTMDHNNATYSSVRMETASIWAVVMRRRERIAAPLCQMVYENWLDEEIGEGRIPFKGGYEAFGAGRDRVCAASWQGPARPTADDGKSAKASSERLMNGTSSIAVETGDLGVDPDTLFEDRKRDHDRYVEAGMTSPYAQLAPKPVIELEPAP